MKNIVMDFFRRGFAACGIGPIVLAVLYMILQHQGNLHTLTVNEVCIGILSLSSLAFVAGGMNAIYQIEQLPLMVAILIHGFVLYIGYLGAYLVNGWLEWGVIPVLVFSGIFVIGYLVIWTIIYSVIKKNTESLNEKIKQKRQSAADIHYE